MKTEFAALSLQEVLLELSRPTPTLILFHARPDGDAIGSAFALSLWLQSKGSRAYCLCADEIPKRLRFLTQGLQESVLPQSLPSGFESARVITVDTASPSQLGGLYEQFADRISLMIDHHGRGTVYADHLVVGCAATGEIIYDIITANKEELPAKCAELLYAAITTDTGGFRYSNTTPATHLRAAAILQSGIDAARLNHLLLEVKSPKLLAAERAGMDQLRFYCDGRVAIVSFPYTLKSSLSLQDEHLETLVDLARRVEGVEVAVAIRQPSEAPVFRTSMRASVDFDVSAVCAEFGGGGHMRAAGATLQGYTCIEEAEKAVLEKIVKMLG